MCIGPHWVTYNTLFSEQNSGDELIDIFAIFKESIGLCHMLYNIVHVREDTTIRSARCTCFLFATNITQRSPWLTLGPRFCTHLSRQSAQRKREAVAAAAVMKHEENRRNSSQTASAATTALDFGLWRTALFTVFSTNAALYRPLENIFVILLSPMSGSTLSRMIYFSDAPKPLPRLWTSMSSHLRFSISPQRSAVHLLMHCGGSSCHNSLR